MQREEERMRDRGSREEKCVYMSDNVCGGTVKARAVWHRE